MSRFFSFFSLEPSIIQRHQMINLILLFLVGKFLLEIPITWFETFIVLSAALIIDHSFIFLRTRTLPYFSYSSLNTALGVLFLLRSAELSVYLIVLLLAFFQKYFFTIKGKHFLNPSNVAVVAGLLFFPYLTHTTPNQWGNAWWIGVLMTIFGLLIALRVKRIVIPLFFIPVYSLYHYIFISNNLHNIFAILISGSFLLFIYFMMTDPRTTPSKVSNQILYAILIATLTFAFELLFGFREINMFLALFITSLFIPLIRYFENKEIQVHIWPSIIVMIIGMLILYFSPYNIKRVSSLYSESFLSSWNDYNQSSLEKNMTITPIFELPTIDSKQIKWNTKSNMYKTTWSHSHIVSLPYNKVVENNNSTMPFEHQATPWVSSNPVLPRDKMGGNYLMHSAIASGDINHDGYLDLIFAHPGYPLMILLNDTKGSFLNATSLLLSKQINNVEHVALVDFDNDGYLDLFVSLNPYKSPEKNIYIYRFDPKSKQFNAYFEVPGKRNYLIGGLSFYDLNKDRIPDFYIGNNFNWENPKQSSLQYAKRGGVSNQLWISSNALWKESKETYFNFSGDMHNSMTVLFTDFNRDGYVDLMNGNDQQADMTFIGTNKDKFNLIDKNKIIYNSSTSMSYFPIDVDNDGIFELWENCISKDARDKLNRYKTFTSHHKIKESSNILTYANLLKILTKEKNCEDFDNHNIISLCKEMKVELASYYSKDETICDNLQNKTRKYGCKDRISQQYKLSSALDAKKNDVELYPRKINKNILLKLQGKQYIDILNQQAALTEWSWAAYPYDLDNNGFQDLYITTGYMRSSYVNPNSLLMGNVQFDKFVYNNQAEDFGVDFLDDARGVMLADFDNDGDGDIMINNVFIKPYSLKNNIGGNSIQMEFRSQVDNYFAIGTQVELHTSEGIKSRELQYGGIWNSMQPHRVHIGLVPGEIIYKALIIWPDKIVQEYYNLDINHIHIFYK